jgi:hypothetical protein
LGEGFIDFSSVWDVFELDLSILYFFPEREIFLIRLIGVVGNLGNEFNFQIVSDGFKIIGCVIFKLFGVEWGMGENIGETLGKIDCTLIRMLLVIIIRIG